MEIFKSSAFSAGFFLLRLEKTAFDRTFFEEIFRVFLIFSYLSPHLLFRTDYFDSPLFEQCI